MNSIQKYIVSTIFFVFFCHVGFPQQLQVNGVVTDTQGHPLPGVNVMVKGTLLGVATDFDGKYSIKVGKNAVLVFSFIGMLPYEAPLDGRTVVHVVMEENAQALDEVVVTFKKPLIEVDRGKMIFNVAASATSSGTSAFDVLKKLPGVGIGQNNEILFRGASGVNVMVNGKMSYLSGNQLSTFIQGMSAGDIESIELITTASAAYDAAGNAGIINITTKRKKGQGYALDLRSSISKGNKWMNNQNVAGSINADTWNGYASLDYNTPHSRQNNRSGNTIEENGTRISLNRKNQSPYDILFYTWKAGFNFSPIPKHTVGVHYHGYYDDFLSYKTSHITKRGAGGAAFETVASVYDLEEPYHYDALNLDYEFAIDSLGKKITADTRYIVYRNFSDGVLESRYYNEMGQAGAIHTMKVRQPGFIKIKSVQADADLPFPEVVLKSGIKFAEVNNDNDFRSEEKVGGDFIEIPELTNHFKYKEQISAAYLSASKTFGKTLVETGLRLEHTKAKAYVLDGSMQHTQDYTRLFPNLSISHSGHEDHKWDMAMGRRINRPAYTDLNPVRWYTDEYFYFSGNPELVPEMGWLFLTSYIWKNKYIVTAEYNKRSNYVSRQLSFDANGTTIRSQSANFDHFDRWDFNITAPFPIGHFWDVRFFGGINYTTYPISGEGMEKTLGQWATTLSLQQQVRFLKHCTLELVTNYTSKELRGIYRTDEVFFADLGVKRLFWGGKLEATFLVSDMFNGFRMHGTSLSSITDYYYRNKPDSRRVGLTLRYHIGGDIKGNSTKTEEQKRL